MRCLRLLSRHTDPLTRTTHNPPTRTTHTHPAHPPTHSPAPHTRNPLSRTTHTQPTHPHHTHATRPPAHPPPSGVCPSDGADDVPSATSRQRPSPTTRRGRRCRPARGGFGLESAGGGAGGGAGARVGRPGNASGVCRVPHILAPQPSRSDPHRAGARLARLDAGRPLSSRHLNPFLHTPGTRFGPLGTTVRSRVARSLPGTAILPWVRRHRLHCSEQKKPQRRRRGEQTRRRR